MDIIEYMKSLFSGQGSGFSESGMTGNLGMGGGGGPTPEADGSSPFELRSQGPVGMLGMYNDQFSNLNDKHTQQVDEETPMSSKLAAVFSGTPEGTLGYQTAPTAPQHGGGKFTQLPAHKKRDRMTLDTNLLQVLGLLGDK